MKQRIYNILNKRLLTFKVRMFMVRSGEGQSLMEFLKTRHAKDILEYDWLWVLAHGLPKTGIGLSSIIGISFGFCLIIIVLVTVVLRVVVFVCGRVVILVAVVPRVVVFVVGLRLGTLYLYLYLYILTD